MALLTLLLFCGCATLAHLTEPPCVIELSCEECVPENMPLVTSHRAHNASLAAAAGDELVLSCGAAHFLAFPRRSLAAVCEAGRYRLRHDASLRHLLELGCQESLFEDVLHQVDGCDPPLQGRAYQVREEQAVRHVSTACFDADRALGVRLRASNAPHNELALAPHSERTSPLSLLGNFNHMFDANTRHAAERLYSDDASLNRRLHELFKHDRVTFAAQSLTSAKLLSGRYFDDQLARAADFVSNRVAAWSSVARGNLDNLHRDVAKFMRAARPHAEVDVYAGTHDVLSLRTGHSRTPVFLKPGERFPVPKYIWTVVHAKRANKALALVLLNDPFVAVSEIREAVFCDSLCGQVAWLHELRRQRNYETPVSGLVFCCGLANFTALVPEMPAGLVNVPDGHDGLLTELFV